MELKRRKPWAVLFTQRVNELYGKPIGNRHPGLKWTAELLEIPYITIWKWARGYAIPTKSRWLSVGVFMGWITDPETDKEGIVATYDYFSSDACKCSEEDLRTSLLIRLNKKVWRRGRRRRKKGE